MVVASSPTASDLQTTVKRSSINPYSSQPIICKLRPLSGDVELQALTETCMSGLMASGAVPQAALGSRLRAAWWAGSASSAVGTAGAGAKAEAMGAEGMAGTSLLEWILTGGPGPRLARAMGVEPPSGSSSQALRDVLEEVEEIR